MRTDVRVSHVAGGDFIALAAGMLVCLLTGGATKPDTITTSNRVNALIARADSLPAAAYWGEAASVSESVNDTNAVQPLITAQRLLRDAVGNHRPLCETGDDDLKTLLRLVSYVATHVSAWEGEDDRDVEVMATALGRIRAELARPFVELPVVHNVRPPLGGSGLLMAGMSPGAIKDSTARARYEEAIRKNAYNNLVNIRHRAIEDLDMDMRYLVIGYLQKALRARHHGEDFTRKCVEEARLTERERDDVLGRFIDR
jgi:hypothetical protein